MYREIPERPLAPPEDKVAGYCAVCGEEIYAGNAAYRCDEGLLHAECLRDYGRETLGCMAPGEIAALFGCLREVAG